MIACIVTSASFVCLAGYATVAMWHSCWHCLETLYGITLLYLLLVLVHITAVSYIIMCMLAFLFTHNCMQLGGDDAGALSSL